jgi:hypothetical protein
MEHVSGGEKDDSRVLGALEELDAIAITEILDHNSRPTFIIIDLDPDLDTVVNPDEGSALRRTVAHPIGAEWPPACLPACLG